MDVGGGADGSVGAHSVVYVACGVGTASDCLFEVGVIAYIEVEASAGSFVDCGGDRVTAEGNPFWSGCTADACRARVWPYSY